MPFGPPLWQRFVWSRLARGAPRPNFRFMLRSARGRIALVLGVLMVALGAWLLASVLILGRPPVTSSRWLDVAFASFFILRGGMNLSSGRRATRRGAAPPNGV